MFIAKLIFSNCVMILSLIIVLSLKNSAINTILAALVAIVVYLICLIQTKILNRTDVALFKYKV